MSTPENPAAEADTAQTALRHLAHATRSIEDPRQIYSTLGSLTSVVGSLSQSLRQLAAFHDRETKGATWVPEGSRVGSAAAYQVSWELHRAAEILNEVMDSIATAHNAEARITYLDRSTSTPSPSRSIEPGISL